MTVTLEEELGFLLSQDVKAPGIHSLSLALHYLWRCCCGREDLLEITLESDELPGAACSRVLDLSPQAHSSDRNLQNGKFWRSVTVFYSLQEGLYALQLADLHLNTLKDIILLDELTA